MIANLRLFRGLARLAAAVAAGIGALALFGWTQGALWLTSVVPGLVPMKPNTSACIMAFSLALGIQSLWPSKPAAIGARIIALASGAIAILTLAEYLFGWHLGIDQFLMLDQTRSGIPGRMGTNTAIALALIGIGVALEAGEADIVILRAHIVTLGAAVVALFTLVGYMYSATYLYQVASTTPMAMNTAIAILLLCGAVLWLKPDRGLMAAVHSADGAGLMLRSMIPAAVIIPVVLGWLALSGERAGFYDTTYGVSLLVLSTIAIFTLLTAGNSRSVRALDATRSRAQKDLEEALVSVEQRVVERTHELNEALARLADSEHRFELATEGSNSGVLDLDILSDKLHCSRRWNEMLGRGGDQPLNTAAFIELVHPDERTSAMRALLAHFKGSTESFSIEVRMRHTDGTHRWMLSRGRALRDERGRAVRMIGSQTDISEIKALQEALRDASIRDGITGLYNRTHFVERLNAATHLAVRHDLPLSFCMFDIDHFKQVNDTYGHVVGDDVIRAVGAAIAAGIRAEDVGARYGGDEFCIMFEGTPAAGAAMCLERIKARVENTPFFSKDGRRFSTTLSFGVSNLADRSVPELIEAADRALYEAKSRGRSRIVVDTYTPPIRKHA
jgi:diguanylate cyclase (GGDEF)-like protein/PAS domain S-box-containing protein